MSKSKKRNNIFQFIKKYLDGVRSESKKVMWTSKKSLVKYSIITLLFVLFICLFFVGTDLIIALISYVKGLLN